jgi:CDP-diacylglycerol--glycerol-3-phosphate 3-phosphatidyltransferase
MVLPNQLTTLRIILTPVFFFLFISGDPVLIQASFIVYIIAAVTDWYDGWLARKFDYITDWGKFMDPLADKILTSSAFIAFVAIGVLELWMVIIVVFRDILITGLRIFAEWNSKSFTTSKIAKLKTLLQMIFIFYLLTVFSFRENHYLSSNYGDIFNLLTDPYWIYLVMLALTLFTFTTGILYLFNNRALIRSFFKHK